MSLFEDSIQADPASDFATRQKQLTLRQALAQKLIHQGMSGNGGARMVGPVFTVGNQLGNVAQGIAGTVMNKMAENDQQALAGEQRQAQGEWSQRYNAATPEQQPQLLVEARNKGLKYDLEQAFAKQEADRIEAGEQKAADRVARAEEADKARVERGEQQAADRVARQELRATPTVHVTTGGAGRGGVKAPSGYRYNEDGTALEPIPGGPADKVAGAKPLTNAQEKAALELGGEFATLNRLASTFQPEYSGDLRSTLQREWGKAAGGAADKKTQAMTRWWSDQAMLDELPTRHALFGAALTATEQKSWKDATISPNLSPDVIRKRLATRQQIASDAAARMKASAVAGGKSGKQFDAAAGITPTRRKYNPATGEIE